MPGSAINSAVVAELMSSKTAFDLAFDCAADVVGLTFELVCACAANGVASSARTANIETANRLYRFMMNLLGGCQVVKRAQTARVEMIKRAWPSQMSPD